MTQALLCLAAVLAVYCATLVLRLLAGALRLRPAACAHRAAPRPAPEPGAVLVVVIPALREQACIVQTMRHFAAMRLPCRLVVVLATTEAESCAAARTPGPTTAQLIDAEIALQQGPVRFARIHYPYKQGVMAHQVNYAVRYLFEAFEEEIDHEATTIGLFNADSHPAESLLAEAVAEVRRGRTVCQASSIYALAARSGGRLAWVSAAAALWQTRWSLGVESFRARIASRLHARSATRAAWQLLRPYHYLVGHGCFFRLRELIEVNYFPQYVPNEDAALGFALPHFGLACHPLHGLDRAEVPRDAGTLLRQQASWIIGPAQAYRYAAYARRSGLQARRALLWLDTAKAGWDAVVWVLGPMLFFASVVGSLLGERGAAVLAAIFLAYLVPANLPLLPLAGAMFPASRSPRLQFLAACLCMPLWYLLHGAGGAWGLARHLGCVVTGRPFLKHKTERSMEQA